MREPPWKTTHLWEPSLPSRRLAFLLLLLCPFFSILKKNPVQPITLKKPKSPLLRACTGAAASVQQALAFPPKAVQKCRTDRVESRWKAGGPDRRRHPPGSAAWSQTPARPQRRGSKGIHFTTGREALPWGLQVGVRESFPGSREAENLPWRPWQAATTLPLPSQQKGRNAKKKKVWKKLEVCAWLTCSYINLAHLGCRSLQP